MAEYKTPGVYIEEIPQLPPSISSVETAIPAFIGYTQKAGQSQPDDLLLIPTKIHSMPQYEQFFGLPQPEGAIEVMITAAPPAKAVIKNTSPYFMHYSLQLFFANGGGPCYIVSVGTYDSGGVIIKADLENGLDAIRKNNEITLIVFPDAVNLPGAASYYSLYKDALKQCAELRNRFTIMDVWVDTDWTVDNIKALRDADLGGADELKFGAAYYPMIKTTIDYACDESAVTIKGIDDPALSGTLAGLKAKDPAHYQEAINAVRNLPVLLPVSPAVAGIYALVDTNRGVWKAPANVNINYAAEPLVHLSDAEQDELNIDGLTGKSINAVRRFPGHGPAIIWGARTLAGNNNEWRYIPVRRFFIMVEGSVRKATSPFVFETNNNETWLRIKTMIKNYLSMQWRSGALAGAKPEHAFYVKLGLGETMTTQDILDGKMIIEIGMAVLRPAEFIIMHLTHQMLAT